MHPILCVDSHLPGFIDHSEPGTVFAVRKGGDTMFGRRMYHRHSFADSKCTLHVSSEVTIQCRTDNELIATADEAHLPGEILAIELIDGEDRSTTQVRVVESCPILVDGSIRHRLR